MKKHVFLFVLIFVNLVSSCKKEKESNDVISPFPNAEVEVKAGSDFLLALLKNGNLYGIGNNSEGQLTGPSDLYDEMVNITSNVRAVSAGGAHVLILKTDQSLWGCGYNQFGQLGVGDTINRRKPVKIMDNVQAVSAGENHTLILKLDGSLWSFGKNDYGQLGIKYDLNNKRTPVKVMDGVIDIFAGLNQSLLLKNDSTLWRFGANASIIYDDNNLKYLSLPSKIMSNIKKFVCGSDFILALKNNGDLWGQGDEVFLGDYWRPGDSILLMSGVRTVEARNYHSFIIKNDNSLYGLGSNNHGEFGIGTQDWRYLFTPIANNIRTITVGENFIAYVDSNNIIWGSGNNSKKQLGNSASEDIIKPIEIKVQ